MYSLEILDSFFEKCENCYKLALAAHISEAKNVSREKRTQNHFS